jgi:predicted DNA-binding transcriptional regulator AlpA
LEGLTMTELMRNEAPASSCRLLSETQVEKLYGLNRRTLQHWRLTGRGPTYRKLGKSVRYLETDIHAFLDAGKRRSTSVSLADAEPVGRA